jgi:hypothetical protein
MVGCLENLKNCKILSLFFSRLFDFSVIIFPYYATFYHIPYSSSLPLHLLFGSFCDILYPFL